MNQLKNYFVTLILLLSINCILKGQVIIDDPPAPEGFIPPAPEEFIFGEFSAEDEKKILERFPADLKADLLKVKELDYNKYVQMIYESQFSHYEVYLGFMDQSEKEMYENERERDEIDLHTEALGIQYQHSNPNDKQAIRNKIRSKLELLFDLKEKQRGMEVQLLERQLKELKESLQVRKNNKSDIINRRLNELIGMDDYLEWD
jgi:hypothetical protein